MKPFYFMVVPLPLIISLNKSQNDRNTRDASNGKLSFLIVLSNKFSTQTNLSTAISLALVAMPPSLCPPCPHPIPLKAHLRSKDP